MAEELEIKLTLAADFVPTVLDWLAREAPETPQISPLRNCYYDTPDADLNRERAALRIRQSGTHYIQTLKTKGEFVDGAHRRNEWEWPLPGLSLNLGLLADTPLAERVNLARLQPVFETNFERHQALLYEGGATVECAVDCGTVAAGEHKWPLNEVEFELKAGESGVLLVFAWRLASEVPLFLNLVSKAEQGCYLAGLYQSDRRHSETETMPGSTFET
jgi:inorganic triphosphatase YgiF